jgi:small subunit ribosomal protein S4
MSKSLVYQSPTKRSRRLDIRVVPKADKYMTRRPYAPGQHGASRKGKPSDYSIQLREKQRAKFVYGMREKQFRNLFEQAQKDKQATGEKLLQLLELRLDNIVFRSGMAKTRRQARQMVSHGRIHVNKKKVNIPSYLTHKDDIISPIKPDGFTFEAQEPPTWIQVDQKKKVASIAKIPSRNDIPLELNEQLIVEFYSR